MSGHGFESRLVHKQSLDGEAGVWLNLCANREKALSGLINWADNLTASMRVSARDSGGDALVVKRNPPTQTKTPLL